VLGGLASASLSLTASIGVSANLSADTVTFLGSVAVGIHISICWVISVNFDGSWQFSQTLQVS
jgi:hypothetical protein